MPETFDTRSLAIGLLAGVAAVAFALPLAGSLATAALLPVIPSAGLLAAAVVTLLRPPRAVAGIPAHRLRPPPGRFTDDLHEPARSPEAWLGEIAVLRLPEDGVRPAIRERLAGQLGACGLDEPRIRLLLAGFRAHAAGTMPGWESPSAFLDALSAAACVAPDARDGTLTALLARVSPELLAPPGDPRHALPETVMLAALEHARRRAPLPPSLFRWLRFTDRGLWFALGNLGRPARLVEGLGPILHHEAEVAAGRGLGTPDVEAGVETLHALATRIRSASYAAPGRGIPA